MVETQSERRQPETAISGSYRKHLEQINAARVGFEQAGVRVVAPATSEAINPGEAFVILTSDDPSLSPRRLETNFLRRLRRTDFLYVANTNGYIGKSAATEMAYARLKGLPVVTAEPIETISNEIPTETQDILRASNAVLPITAISQDRIKEIKATGNALTPEQQKRLSHTVVKLIRELGSSPVAKR